MSDDNGKGNFWEYMKGLITGSPPLNNEDRELRISSQLASLGRCLMDLVEQEALVPILGRDKEINACVSNLSQGNNLIIVGDNGVGKTAILEGIAMEASLDYQLFSWEEIVETNITALQGETEYARVLETKFGRIIQNLKKQEALLAVTDIHLGIGAGSSCNNPNGDCVNLFNDLLSDNGLTGFQMIGTTTPSGYGALKRTNPAFMAKFVRIDIPPLSMYETTDVLLRSRRSLEDTYDLRISPAAIRKIVEITEQYVLSKEFPGKAFDFLRSAAGFCEGGCLNVAQVYSEFERISGLRQSIVNEDVALDINDIMRALSREIFGQDNAVQEVANAITKFKAGLCDPRRPAAVFTFFGPTGTGKTEFAKQIAIYMFGSEKRLFSYPLGMYQGERGFRQLLGIAGTTGSDVFDAGKLLDDVSSAPFSVVLLDEVDHASPAVINALYQILDEGVFVDKKGTEVSFRNTIIILTTNIGAEELCGKKSLLSLCQVSDLERRSDALADAHLKLEKELSPAFFNRTTPVAFNPLTGAVLRDIAVKTIERILGKGVLKRGARIEVGDKLLEKVVFEGYDQRYGARSMERAVNKLIVNPLSVFIAHNPGLRGEVIDVDDDGRGGTTVSMRRDSDSLSSELLEVIAE